jgi:hypothetical protein
MFRSIVNTTFVDVIIIIIIIVIDLILTVDSITRLLTIAFSDICSTAVIIHNTCIIISIVNITVIVIIVIIIVVIVIIIVIIIIIIIIIIRTVNVIIIVDDGFKATSITIATNDSPSDDVSVIPTATMTTMDCSTTTVHVTVTTVTPVVSCGSSRN